MFAVLLLVSAGMVSVPGGSDTTSDVRVFYESNAALIVVAQLVGLLAALSFTPFAMALQQRGTHDQVTTGAPWVGRSGLAVTGAAIVTAVPVLWLVAVVKKAGNTLVNNLAYASDLTDVVLFMAIAAFGAAILRAASVGWLRVLAGLVALICAARAGLLLAGSGLLELLAPLAFVLLVLVLSTMALARRSILRPMGVGARKPADRPDARPSP